MNAAGQRFGLPMEVYGPETHIAVVLPMALGWQPKLAEADAAVSSSPPSVRKKTLW